MLRVRSLCLAAIAAAGLAFPAAAAGPDAEGAGAITRALTGFLPKKLVDSGFVSVRPAGDHYALALDFGRLATAFTPRDTVLGIAGRYDLEVYPPQGSDGLMAVRRAASPFETVGSYASGPNNGSFVYRIDNLSFDGTFDPALRFFRSASSKATGGSVQSEDGRQTVEASFGPMDQSMTGTADASGAATFAGRATIADFKEKVTGEGMPSVAFSIGTLGVEASVTALKIPELSALLGFVIERAEKPTLDAAEKKALAGLVSAAMPVLGGIEETIRGENLVIDGPGFGARVESFDYRFGMDGFRDKAALRLGFGLRNPDISGVPQMLVYGDLLPKEFTADLAIPGLNFASTVDTFLAQANFDADEPLTPAQSAALGKQFLSTGRLDIDVTALKARSALYDITVTGRFSTDVEAEPAKANASFEIAARDLDTTIKGVQAMAERAPDLASASFMLMMAKGMAKTDADGTSRWKIDVTDAGTVTVNGQPLPQ